jgi:thiol:disulfide interchange protein DsbC
MEFIMQKRMIKLFLPFMAVMMAGYAVAGDSSRAAIEKSLHGIVPDFKIDDIAPSPIKGISEVLVGPQLFYVTNDGKYIFQGSLIEIESRIDISEERRKTIRLDAVNAMGEDKMIVFPASKPRHTITVFTDIDCGYCRKLHDEMDQYNAMGITVRYLMYPRSGVNTPSYYKAVSVWCKDDRNAALTDSKGGKTLPRADCDNPIQAHMELGELLGVRGTPAIVLDDGEMMPGYVPAVRLSKALDKKILTPGNGISAVR